VKFLLALCQWTWLESVNNLKVLTWECQWVKGPRFKPAYVQVKLMPAFCQWAWLGGCQLLLNQVCYCASKDFYYFLKEKWNQIHFELNFKHMVGTFGACGITLENFWIFSITMVNILSEWYEDNIWNRGNLELRSWELRELSILRNEFGGFRIKRLNPNGHFLDPLFPCLIGQNGLNC